MSGAGGVALVSFLLQAVLTAQDSTSGEATYLEISAATC